MQERDLTVCLKAYRGFSCFGCIFALDRRVDGRKDVGMHVYIPYHGPMDVKTDGRTWTVDEWMAEGHCLLHRRS